MNTREVVKNYNYYKELYEKKGEQLILNDNSIRYYEKNFGFIYYSFIQDPHTHEKVCLIDHSCVEDIHRGEEIITRIAKEAHCDCLRTLVHRSPRAYRKLSRGIIDVRNSGVLPNGLYYYAFYKRL